MDEAVKEAVPVKGVTIAPGWRVRISNDIALLKSQLSTWLALIFGVVQLLGPQIRETWASLPDDLKAVLPGSVQKAIAYAILFFMFIAARSLTFERKEPKQ